MSDGRAHGDRASLRSVTLPSEHGGWSLTAEPALLGLLVAWSLPGLALGLAALVAFVARTPLKLVLVDRWRHRWLERTALAARVAAVELLVFGGLVAYASVEAQSGFWLPLALAAPMIGLELWFDMRSRGRRLIPELAGSIGIGAIATAIALADGASDELAWGLWIVIAVRVIAAIPYVRYQIQRTRSRPGARWPSDIAQVAATSGAAVAWQLDLVPAVTVAVIAALGLLNVAAVRVPPRPAVVIGVQQTIFGIVLIVATALAAT